MRYYSLSAAILAALVLSDCSAVTPLMQNQSEALSQSHVLTPNTSLCAYFNVRGRSGSYDFRGSCADGTLTGSGATLALKQYKGLSLTVKFGSNNIAPHNNTVILGDAIGTGDITGAIGGEKFPLYGSTQCTTPGGRTTPCVGKAFIYFALKNDGVQPGFVNSPKITIVNSGSYPGTKECAVVYMLPHRYYILPLHAAPSGHTLAIMPAPALASSFFPVGFQSGSSFFYGIACR
jgi:hypothetical protein